MAFITGLKDIFPNVPLEIYLFGSFLTNRFRPDSDVDLLIVASKKSHREINEALNGFLLNKECLYQQ